MEHDRTRWGALDELHADGEVLEALVQERQSLREDLDRVAQAISHVTEDELRRDAAAALGRLAEHLSLPEPRATSEPPA